MRSRLPLVIIRHAMVACVYAFVLHCISSIYFHGCSISLKIRCMAFLVNCSIAMSNVGINIAIIWWKETTSVKSSVQTK